MIRFSEPVQSRRQNRVQVQICNYLNQKMKTLEKFQTQIKKAETYCLDDTVKQIKEGIFYQSLLRQQQKKINQFSKKCKQLENQVKRTLQMKDQIPKKGSLYNQQRIQTLENNLMRQKTQQEKLKMRVKELQQNGQEKKAFLQKHNQLQFEFKMKNQLFLGLQKIQENNRTKIMMFDQRHFQLLELKKKLNLQLQQMKGNIRVYCRIRPVFTQQTQFQYITQQNLLQIRKAQAQVKSTNLKRNYQFVVDRIFDQQSTQIEVFEEVSQIVQSAIDGKDVCIFAYGQTGSGKTFTMQGKQNAKKGLIPRSISLIFQEIQKNSRTNSVAFAVYEIYNDLLINLLENQRKSSRITFIQVKDESKLHQSFTQAIKNRAKSFTKSNAQSSRSHLIFIIQIKSRIRPQQQPKLSHLVMVDLAGAERIKKSAVTARELKQAQHINKSLTELGTVIRSLKKGQKTNFRNCKLTHVLQPYLEKGSRALMFVNVSPSKSDVEETLNSLKFACIARECVIE